MKNLKKYGQKMGFFGNEKGDFNVSKKDFQENTLVYTNQAAISTIKGELSVYFQNFTFSQVIPLQNPPPNLEEYCFKPNEVKLVIPVYNNETGKFQG